MKIEYTDHALERLKERSITKREVVEAIRLGRKENTSGGLRRATHRNLKGILIVIYSTKAKNRVGIVSAYRP